MSSEEIREYCLSLCSYKLKAQVRLKDGREVLVGRITGVEAERFQFVGDDDVEQQLRFAWVARIRNA